VEAASELASSPDYEKEVFVNNARAKELITDKTILVVVDVNRPSMTECPELLNKAKCVVVLDHHRQTKEVISGATLSYVEPSASSACEMVAEILQYYNSASPVKVTPLDADAMYAGMVVDTNQFTAKTGVRTFEAAAYLRRCGTEVSRIRKMFREEPSDYLVRAKTVQRTEMFRDHFAISVCEGNTQEAITVVAAQAANELLDLKNVTAAFVLCKSAETIYISARSIDEVNVQLVMERLGGGGHMNIAGAQIKDGTFEDVILLLKDTLTQMEENNEI
jgi:c-di-AMP phosphodiesterase-like protein